jgi:hypothetical protein
LPKARFGWLEGWILRFWNANKINFTNMVIWGICALPNLLHRNIQKRPFRHPLPKLPKPGFGRVFFVRNPQRNPARRTPSQIFLRVLALVFAA